MDIYIYNISPQWTPFNFLILTISIIFEPPWVYQTLWTHTRKHCVKFSLMETAWSPRYDNFSVSINKGPLAPSTFGKTNDSIMSVTAVPLGNSLDPSKLMSLIIFGLFWVGGALDNISTSIMSNYHFGKRPVAER